MRTGAERGPGWWLRVGGRWLRGGVLALFYALGLSLALGVTAFVVIHLVRRIATTVQARRLVRDICGLTVMVLGLLNVSGLMTHYKAFFLGFLV